jgi:hypothetical protein
VLGSVLLWGGGGGGYVPYLKVMKSGAHNALGHRRLELVAELAHFHLEIAEDILFLLGGEKLLLLLPALSLLAPAAPAHHTQSDQQEELSQRIFTRAKIWRKN